MSQQPEYIQLEPNDDVPHVRDRLSFIRGRRVLLIWPENGTALTRKLDLVLVQREAKRRAIQLALVTHDILVTQHAEELGISVFETIDSSERGRWKRGRTKVFTQRHHKPKDDPEPDDLIEVASRVKKQHRSVSAIRYALERLMVLAIVVVVFGFTAYVVAPSADVMITLPSEELRVETSITADPIVSDVDVENGVIPATILRAEVTSSGTIETTGSSSLGNLAAIGVVVFTNQSLNRVEIPANTIVATNTGTPIRFRTISDVSVRGGVGERAETAIEALAENDGNPSNVDAGTITVVEGSLAGVVNVLNLSPTTGGETRQFSSFTEDDRNRLLSIVRTQLQSTAYDEMRSNISDGQIIVIETIRIAEERDDWTTFDHQVGEITPTVSLTMRVIVEAVSIDDRFGRQILFARLSAQKPSGQVLIADSFNYERGAVTNVNGNTVTFTANGNVSANAEISTIRLAERIANQSVEQAQQIILQEANFAPITVDIQISPQGFSQMPILPIRINIRTVVQ
jgi:hypothetical protein